MSDTLASQVAAGEVIERPASVIKELVENSLDAGASHIQVEIQRGGIASMKITDDGCGMSREDAQMSLQRHATSKLRTSEQLESISTMGFRGEAIPSIASVGRFRLMTCEKGQLTGTEILVNGGEVNHVKDAGCAEGTVVEVRDLFYNIPARRKFLKAETTEAAHIEHQIRLQALAHPEVRFTLRRDGRPIFDLPVAKDPQMRVAALSGADVTQDMVPVTPLKHRGVHVKGYVLKAIHARPGRKHQFFFLNNRPIEDSALSAALRESYGSVVGKGLNPGGWIWLEIDPRDVDVNVHPAKREVRFHKVHEVRQAVLEAVSQSLRPVVSETVTTDQEVDDFSHSEPTIQPRETQDLRKSQHSEKRPQSETPHIPVEKYRPTHSVVHESVQKDLPVPNAVTEDSQRVGAHSFRVIGPLRERYFVLEGDEGLVLLDPQAARERIIYEQMLASAKGAAVATQGLLVPILLELDARDADIVLRHSQHFSDAGIEVEEFGKGTLQVRAIPAFLKKADPQAMLLKMIDELVESGGVVRREMAFEAFAARFSSIAARDEKISSSQAEILLDQLFTTDLPFCGADGRPTLIQLSLQELDRRFGRK